MALGPYASFIAASYLVAGLVVLALIVWIAADFRRQTERLRQLDASGASRRSGRSAKET